MIPFDKMIEAQLSHFDFGDKRLNTRCGHCVRQIIDVGAQNSFPRIFKDPYQLKAFYRLMNNEKIDHEDFFLGYQKGVIAQLKAQDGSPKYQHLYLFNDTTFGKYHDRQLQLGYIERPTDNGIIIHTSILTDAQMLPLSPAVQQLYMRPVSDFGKKHQRRTKPFEQKESYKWTKSVEWARDLSHQTGATVVQVNDRESDIAELYNFAFEHNQFFIVRSAHNRYLLNEERLWDHIRKQVVIKEPVRQLLDKKGNAHPVSCQLRFAKVELRNVDQEVFVVHLLAQKTSVDLETTEWFLLTNLPLEEAHQAEQIIDVYVNRWRTCEDFHKCLKTGCQVQKRQFNSSKALLNSIALLSLVGVRLLRMRYIAQLEEQQPLKKVLSPEEVQLVELLAPQYLKPVDLKQCQPGTVLWGILLIARLGGHQGYKHHGLPGWQTLYHGWNHFQTLLNGINLSKNFFSNTDP